MNSTRTALLVGCLVCALLLAGGDSQPVSANGSPAVDRTAAPTAPPGNETATTSESPSDTSATNRTGASTPTPSPTINCPSFRGAAPSLCEPTPSPSPSPTPLLDKRIGVDNDSDEPDAWLSGVLPLAAWIAAVVVVAPAVLGGLMGLDALRSGGGE